MQIEDGEHPDLGVERHCGAGGNKDEFNANMSWFADYFWNEATQKRKPKRKAKKNRGEIERKRSVVKAQIFTYWSNE